MKTIITFPIILAGLFPSVPTNPTLFDPFSKVSIAPLFYGQVSTFVVETRTASRTMQFYICNDMYNDKLIGTVNPKRTGKHFLKYNNEYTRSNNQIYFSYTYNNEIKYSPKVTLKPGSTSYKNLVDNQSFETRNKVSTFEFGDSDWSSHSISYSFENFDGLYMPDYYHKIRLNDFEVKINSDDRPLFSCNPSLVISNVDGVFNDVASGGSVEFPLKTVSTNNGYAFELKDAMYVHKETLKMSSNQKAGYVPTKYIYLPRNEMQNQTKYSAYFALQNFGIDNDFVKHSFQLKALKNIIGDCHNSEYCIQRS